VSLDQLRPLVRSINDLDPDTRWAGGSVALPQLRIELYLDDNPSLRNVSLVAMSSPQSYSGWRTLEKSRATQFAHQSPRVRRMFVPSFH